MGILDIFKTQAPGANTIKRLQKIVDHINDLEPIVSEYSDDDLRNQTFEFKNRLEKGETVEDIKAEAFSVVREVSKRVLGMRHYDVQMIGGLVIHEGSISEMRTGEGKTLVATLPIYLNALLGKGVHLVTVNDYLARRDLAWMGQIYNFLGLTSAVINSGNLSYQYDEEAKAQDSDVDKSRDEEGYFKISYDFLRPITRKEAYECDITYGTNSEFGFDYLRDNLVYNIDSKTQRDHAYVIIDEIDSVLIDEARTPLIISARHSESENFYQTFAHIADDLKIDLDYLVDEKLRQVQVLDAGVKKAEELLQVDNLYGPGNIKLVHHLETAVRAKALFLKDKDYVLQNNEVVIVDESTGRLMPTRRWSGGLHQAVEAKEGLTPKDESRTFASITYQNYFRLYKKLSGMTGTALTSREEFYKVYSLDVIVIPTNRPIQRIDRTDLIYLNKDSKFKAISQKIKDLHVKGQPVLVGTVSVESNEELSQFFKKSGIPHQVLNAKNHESEAQIIADAGKHGSITIATNMAGRGVDIKLGGEGAVVEEYEKVKALGGLFVLATERHSSRRIDNQLRGRSGRQGDPGETQFYVSLDDDLMRVFGGDRLKSMMSKGLPENEAIESKLVSRSIEKAQERVEGHNFDSRKSILSYDDVLNTQRTSIYDRRNAILKHSHADLEVAAMDLTDDSSRQFIQDQFKNDNNNFGESIRKMMLQVIDQLWVDHLEAMDFLRTSVGLQSYGQQEPLVEYKKQGLAQFKALEESILNNTKEIFNKMATQVAEFQKRQIELDKVQAEARAAREQSNQSIDLSHGAAPKLPTHNPIINEPDNLIGRNDMVTIQKSGQTQTIKFKKAQELLADGWTLVVNK